MRTVKYDVLITLTQIIKKYAGNWCYVSRDKLLELLKTHHKINIGYRQLGNHLADLRDAGLIKSIRRNHRRADGTLCLLTSARCLTIKGCKYLKSRGFVWAKIHMQKLRAKYIPPKPGKPYSEKPLSDQVKIPTNTEKNPFLDPGYRKKHGLPPLPPFKTQTS